MAEVHDSDTTAKPPPPSIYRYVGARTGPDDDDGAVGTLQLAEDLVGPDGLLAAPLAVLFQDLSSSTVVRYAPYLVPLQVDVRIRGGAPAGATLFATGRAVHRGRTFMASEAAVYAAEGDATPIAVVSGTWATMGSKLDTPLAPHPGPGTEVPPTPDPPRQATLLATIGAVRRSDGRGYDLPEVDPGNKETIALGGPASSTLHAGAIQVMAEGAARLVGEQAVGGDRLVIEDLSTQFLVPARVVPIAAVAEVVMITDGSVDCRVQVREDGGAGRLAALSRARFRRQAAPAPAG